MDVTVRALSHILVPCFFVGMCGSLVVVVVTIIRDLREVLTEDEIATVPEKVTGA